MNGFWSRFIASFVYYWTKSIWEVRDTAFTLPGLFPCHCLWSGAGREVEGGRREVRGWDDGKEGLMCSSCGAGGIRKESRSPVAVCLLFTGTIGEIVRRGGISLTSLNCSVSKGWSPRGVDCELGGRREVEGAPPTPKPSSLPSLRSKLWLHFSW